MKPRIVYWLSSVKQSKAAKLAQLNNPLKVGKHMWTSCRTIHWECIIYVSHPDFVEEAKHHFKNFKINIVTGQRFLGGFIGCCTDTKTWLHNKITTWLNAIINLHRLLLIIPSCVYILY